MRHSDRDEFIDVHFDNLLRQTDKAFLVDVGGEEAWVAKSQVDNADELEAELKKPAHKREGLDIIQVPKWIAAANGWVDDE
jgi:hypothetical protein